MMTQENISYTANEIKAMVKTCEKYNKAFERVRDLMKNQNPQAFDKHLIEMVFPELAESEDERIRKEIITHFRNTRCVTEKGAEKILQWIAWLEKQGDYNRLVEEMKKRKELLSKEKEKATSANDKLSLGGRIAMLQELLAFNICNTTDNVESKFKVDDWVVQENVGIYKVIKVCESWYEVIDDLNNHYSIGFDKEYMCHLWSINDAKDGDVLYSIDSKQPFIYKERPQFSQAIGYCCINKFGEFAIWGTHKCVICTDKYIPATKEQIELLFAKMHDAGYTWDNEKKELKKIEPKTLNADKVIEWIRVNVPIYGNYMMIDKFKEDFGL